jgi:hypothetical protein
MGPVACASLKVVTLFFLTHDVFVVCASIMPEPRRRGDMATVTPSVSGQLVVYWVARASPTTVDPCPRSLRYKTKPDNVSEGSAPNLAPLRRWLHDLLLRPDVDVKSAPHAKHTASRISWLTTRDPGVESRSVPVNFPWNWQRMKIVK